MPDSKPMDRRRFLKATLAGAGAACVGPVVVPASVLGGEGKAPAGERITIGMIGMGRQAYKVNMKQLLGMPDVQIVAVCDVDSWRLANAKSAIEQHYGKAAIQGTYRGCEAYVDLNDVLARDDIDAVMISTPDHWHIPMAIAAMEAGKDVSLEKPITRTIAEGRALSDAAARLQRVFRVDSEFRSARGVHRAAELVRNGRIGEVHTVTVGVPGTDVGCPPQPDMPVPSELDYERWQGPAPRAAYTEKRVHTPRSYNRPGWMRHLFYCDGMITNWGTHLADGAMWCTGLERTGPVAVEGSGTYPPPESFWNVCLKFEVKYRFGSGVRWTYRTERPYFKIEGTAGWIQADFRTVEAEPASILDSPIGPDEVRFRLKSDKRDFIDCVKAREETLEPAEVGHRVTSLCHLGHIAIQVGEELTWDAERERFVGSAAANELVDKPIHTPKHLDSGESR
ncbi:MAG: Gfo/Idh/MocA family oxidoreductase [Armatimonadota bacterium]|jgi:predicted dehydrogenase